jgi:hypothetical protein
MFLAFPVRLRPIMLSNQIPEMKFLVCLASIGQIMNAFSGK